tara:strand:- start:134 stop:436 length:303 start_codon:yes stop_codon:yes gene_type:complete
MVKSEIILKLSDEFHRKVKKSQLDRIINIIFNKIINEAKHKRATEIRQFGRFSQKKIKERKNARNPKTGEIIETKERLSITFKMSQELKKKINDTKESLN